MTPSICTPLDLPLDRNCPRRHDFIFPLPQPLDDHSILMITDVFALSGEEVIDAIAIEFRNLAAHDLDCCFFLRIIAAI